MAFSNSSWNVGGWIQRCARWYSSSVLSVNDFLYSTIVFCLPFACSITTLPICESLCSAFFSSSNWSALNDVKLCLTRRSSSIHSFSCSAFFARALILFKYTASWSSSSTTLRCSVRWSRNEPNRASNGCQLSPPKRLNFRRNSALD